MIIGNKSNNSQKNGKKSKKPVYIQMKEEESFYDVPSNNF